MGFWACGLDDEEEGVLVGLLVGEDTWSLVVGRRLGLKGKWEGVEEGWREWWLTAAMVVVVVGGDRRGVQAMCELLCGWVIRLEKSSQF